MSNVIARAQNVLAKAGIVSDGATTAQAPSVQAPPTAPTAIDPLTGAPEPFEPTPVVSESPKSAIAQAMENARQQTQQQQSKPQAQEPVQDVKAVKPEDFIPDDDLEQLYEPVKDPGEINKHFAKFRTKLKHTTKDLKAKTEELETIKKKLEEYETGAALPSVVGALQQRVAELETHEKLVSFKTSKEYKEKFLDPLETNRAKVQEVAKEYGVPDEVITQALSVESTAELNRLLSPHITDELGAAEVKSLVKSIQQIRKEAASAEKNPDEVFNQIRQERAAREQQEQINAKARVATTAKNSWTDALVTARQENAFPELMYREDDDTHNEQVVRPILAKAGHEYGKIVAALAESGLKELPKDVGIAMSRMTQLAHVAGVLQAERATLSARVKELEGLLSKYTTMYRPGVNGTSPAPNRAATPVTTKGGLEGVAAKVLSKVLN